VTRHLLTYAGDIYWVKTTNKSCVYEEIKSWLAPAKAQYHQIQALLCSRHLSKNIKT